ncbi:MAG TPA: hypothetical protein VFY40_04450 [Blastocatellia bacterium]|nr:hypothetical protein [Blastocatellia bacterium]
MPSAFITISKYSLIRKCLRATFRLSGCAIFAVILALLLQRSGAVHGAPASEGSEPKARIAPVGAIESFGAIRINGRLAHSGTVLWGGELLEAPAIESAQITLKEMGLITLSGGSALKLVCTPKEGDGAPILFAHLIAGSMTIRLNGRAGARICASNSIFAVSPGSSARLLVSEGHGRLLSSKGEVKEDSDWRLFQAARASLQAGAQQTPGEYKIAPYNFTFGLGGYADIEARSVRYLQFRVTDKDDKPAPDMLLLILLKKVDGSTGAGSINYGASTMSVSTDQDGVATVRFDASVTIGAHSAIEVTIVKTNQTLKGNIRIVKGRGFWTLKNAAPLMTTVATSVVVAAIAGQSYGGEFPAVSPAPVEEESDPADEPEMESRRRWLNGKEESERFIYHHSARRPHKHRESQRDRRRDYPERSHSEGRENHRKFHGAAEHNRPHHPQPKSKRGGSRTFRGKFGVTFSVKH